MAAPGRTICHGFWGTTRTARSIGQRLQLTRPQRRHMTLDQLDAAKGNRERVVILGSGWGGYPFARALDSRKFQAVIVSPRSYFVFTPLLASTAVGTLEFRTALEPVRKLSGRGVEYIQGWADAVDLYARTVAVETTAVTDPRQALAPVQDRYAGKSAQQIRRAQKGQVIQLQYDKLVVAVGCYSQTFDAPGVREHAFFLKDVGDARRIRKRLLECFECAALPTTSEQTKRSILRFAVIGGGPTGIEFSAELHDLVHEDLARMYPELIQYCSITVYDVAPAVLSMFDSKLANYAMETFRREGIEIKTSRHVQEVRPGLPHTPTDMTDPYGQKLGMTLSVKDEGDFGVGMVVWSTGLMANPFVSRMSGESRAFPRDQVIFKAGSASVEDASEAEWHITSNAKTGSLITNDRLRLVLEAPRPRDTSAVSHTQAEAGGKDEHLPPLRAVTRNVFAIGDCAQLEGTQYPATAQVANQKGEWLARRLNHDDLHTTRFNWRNMGTLAYIGNWKAILQGDHGHGISGRTAWIIWRGAYLVKSVSWRNRVLIPVYWILNWLLGRDVSRF